MKAKIKKMLKGNHNSSRKHLQALATVYYDIERIALEIQDSSQFEINHLAGKLLEKLKKMERVVYRMCKGKRGKD